MAKIHLNSSGVKSNCIIKINDTVDLINKTLNCFNNFDIPSDFSKKNTLRNVQSDLKKVKDNLNGVVNWLNSSLSDYNTLLNKLNDQSRSLPNYKVKSRNNIV